MAAVTGIGFITSRMTGGAGGYSTFTMIHGEGVISIESGGGPGGGGVAGNTVCAKFARVLGRLGMAGEAG